MCVLISLPGRLREPVFRRGYVTFRYGPGQIQLTQQILGVLVFGVGGVDQIPQSLGNVFFCDLASKIFLADAVGDVVTFNDQLCHNSLPASRACCSSERMPWVCFTFCTLVALRRRRPSSVNSYTSARTLTFTSIATASLNSSCEMRSSNVPSRPSRYDWIAWEGTAPCHPQSGTRGRSPPLFIRLPLRSSSRPGPGNGQSCLSGPQ